MTQNTIAEIRRDLLAVYARHAAIIVSLPASDRQTLAHAAEEVETHPDWTARAAGEFIKAALDVSQGD